MSQFTKDSTSKRSCARRLLKKLTRNMRMGPSISMLFLRDASPDKRNPILNLAWSDRNLMRKSRILNIISSVNLTSCSYYKDAKVHHVLPNIAMTIPCQEFKIQVPGFIKEV